MEPFPPPFDKTNFQKALNDTTPIKILAKILLPKKIPNWKLSNPQKSFDHPCHLKSGVPPPLPRGVQHVQSCFSATTNFFAFLPLPLPFCLHVHVSQNKQAYVFVLLGNPVYGRWFLDGSDPDVRLVAIIHI